MWRGMTDDDIEGAANTNTHGGEGRLALGGKKITKILHDLFPDEFWDEIRPEVYDFSANRKTVEKLLETYINDEPRFSRLDFLNSISQKKHRRRIAAHEVLDFFELGERLQKDGKEPAVFGWRLFR